MLVEKIDQNLVLVGAGNAHLVVLKRWAMAPIPNTRLTLINDAWELPYSAMIPGWLCGDFAKEAAFVDLVRLCSSVGASFINANVSGFDRENRRILLCDRAPVHYDLMSLALGSIHTVPP